MDEISIILFGAFFISAFVWLYLVARLFRMLKTNHADKYRAMGEPTLIWNNSLRTNYELLKFLARREYRELDDPSVSTLGRNMLIFLMVYLFGFLFFVIWLDFP